DAESRGMNGTMWALLLVLLAIFTGLIGGIILLVVYLVVRGNHPVGGRPMYAPYGYPPPGYPPYAGMPPPAPPPAPPVQPSGTTTTCRSCGAPLPAGVAFCPNCGTKL
ncbi:MAG: zinc-ribbon domain-containing protein, partial [Methanobacteriota archaeon]